MTKDIRSEVFHREIALDLRLMDSEARTVPASLSSEAEIKRFFGKEVLVHNADAINLERAATGLPLLFGHNQDQPIGRVEDVAVKNNRLQGTLRFSKNPRANEIWEDVREGFLTDISIGYRIDAWEEEDGSDIVRATRWTPFEASVVSVPADYSVGINRSKENQVMDDPTGTEPTVGVRSNDDNGGVVNVAEFQTAREQARLEGERAAQAKLLKRITDIDAVFSRFMNRGAEFVQLKDECVRNGSTPEAARQSLMDLLAGDPQPLAGDLIQAPGSANSEDEQVRTIESPQGRRTEHISGGKDWIERYREGVTDALLVRVGVERDEKKLATARQNEYLSMSPMELCREYLRNMNVPTGGMSRDKIVGAALTTRGLISHSTSDFANILEDVSNKSLQIGYSEAPETWSMWARTGSIPDFRQANRPNLSAYSDLDVIPESGEYDYGSFTDLKEVMTLATYGKMFSISRQALVNDDLDALGRIPAAMGRSAARTIGDLAYNVLILGITNTLNQDGLALFHATHGNYVAPASGAAPSVATIEAARTAMATQTDPSGVAILNIRPRYLIVPFALEGTSLVLQDGEYDPAGTAGTLTPNTVRNTFTVVADGRLDAYDPLAWFMAADPSMVETVEVAFLDGQQTPYMETQNGWSTDGVSYKVRIDAVAAPLDFRGLYKNDGN
jgi:HK97 family phage prohead protease